MAEVLKKFGRYFLLDRIAQGGMAEIYRARMATANAGGRLLVIKRIQAGFGSNNEFQSMFKSEIQVTMGFNHPNIVQVYDFGEESKQPYIAMELVDGKNLRQFITRFGELKQPMPIDLAAYIIEQAAAGLFYAHSFKDKITGESLNIVHRDISPQNILISYEGNIKVIDFGIAKATVNSESTRAGVIKGKPSYLSPEQINGDPLDARCDIFALGAVLWELLVGKKLFSGDNDLAVLKQIEGCSQHVKPPSTFNADVPKEMDYIVLKALAKQKESRFQTADEFRRALHKFIYTFNQDFNPGDLSYYAKDLFKAEIVEDRKRVQSLYEKAENLLTEDITETGSNSESTSGGQSGVVTSVSKRKEETTTVFDLNGAPVSPTSAKSPPSPKSPPQPNAGMRKIEMVSQRVDLELNPAVQSRSFRRPTQTFTRPNSTKSTETENGGGFAKVLFLAVASSVALFLWGPETLVQDTVCKVMPSYSKCEISRHPDGDTGTQTTSQTSLGADPRTAQASPTPTVEVNPWITIRLLVLNGSEGVSARIGDRAFPPTLQLQVRRDVPLLLEVEKPKYKRFSREFTFRSKDYEKSNEVEVSVTLEPTSFGSLSLRSTPSAEAEIYPYDRSPSSNGEPLYRKSTPFDSFKMPPGKYRIKLKNETLGMEKTVSVQIIEGKLITIDERLEIRQ